MNFSNKRVELLWQFVNPTLQNNIMFFNLWVQQKFGDELLLTSTVRLLSEQKAINLARAKVDRDYKPVYPGPHPLGNAVDASRTARSGHQWTLDEVKEIVAEYNKQFPYEFERMVSCMYHDVAGFHLHFQINPRIYGTGINQNDPVQYEKLIVALRGL